MTTVVHSHSYPEISSLAAATHVGKSVFIAGASRGIGLAIAISFAQAGTSQIAIAARSNLESAKKEILEAASKAKRPEPKVLCVKLDVTSQSNTEEAAKTVEKEFGKLDIVVINAAIFPTMSLIADSDPDTWWEGLNVNLRGPYLISRAFLPLLLKGGDKTIITVASVGAHLVTPAASAYQLSKLAVWRLMQSVAVEYESQGVVTISIHPGNIITDMVPEEGLPPDLVAGEFAKVRERLVTDVRVVFTETADLPGDTVVFLTKEKRSWLSGRYVNVTWDMPELMAKESEIVKGDKLKLKFDF